MKNTKAQPRSQGLSSYRPLTQAVIAKVSFHTNFFETFNQPFTDRKPISRG